MMNAAHKVWYHWQQDGGGGRVADEFGETTRRNGQDEQDRGWVDAVELGQLVAQPKR
jgi:hypothetical protein